MKLRLMKLVVCLSSAALVTLTPLASADSTLLPSVKMQGGVRYVTGGIGENEAAAFKDAASRYPLELLFAENARPKDAYIADVRVNIWDRSGNSLLHTKTEGPFLLAALPDGTYQIEAEYRGIRKRQTIQIHAGKHRRAVFVWASQGAQPYDAS